MNTLSDVSPVEYTLEVYEFKFTGIGTATFLGRSQR